MTCDLDIYRSANLIMKQHGDDAEWYAGDRADALSLEGDVEGSLVWMRVLRAIQAFRAPRRVGEDPN